MDTTDPKHSTARNQAEDRFAKITRRDAEVKALQQQQWDAEAAKIAKLRALRLARESAEAQSLTAPKKPARARGAKPTKSA